MYLYIVLYRYTNGVGIYISNGGFVRVILTKFLHFKSFYFKCNCLIGEQRWLQFYFPGMYFKNEEKVFYRFILKHTNKNNLDNLLKDIKMQFRNIQSNVGSRSMDLKYIFFLIFSWQFVFQIHRDWHICLNNHKFIYI